MKRDENCYKLNSMTRHSLISERKRSLFALSRSHSGCAPAQTAGIVSLDYPPAMRKKRHNRRIIARNNGPAQMIETGVAVQSFSVVSFSLGESLRNSREGISSFPKKSTTSRAQHNPARPLLRLLMPPLFCTISLKTDSIRPRAAAP